MFCWKCGHQNDENAFRCVTCGTELRPMVPAQTVQPRVSGMAIASMVCSIAGFMMCFFIGQIVGIVLGYNARKEIKSSQGSISGEGFATAGIIIGWIGLIIDLLLIAIMFMFGIFSVILPVFFGCS